MGFLNSTDIRITRLHISYLHYITKEPPITSGPLREWRKIHQTSLQNRLHHLLWFHYTTKSPTMGHFNERCGGSCATCGHSFTGREFFKVAYFHPQVHIPSAGRTVACHLSRHRLPCCYCIGLIIPQKRGVGLARWPAPRKLRSTPVGVLSPGTAPGTSGSSILRCYQVSSHCQTE